MIENPCLRPATIHDATWSKFKKHQPSRHWPGMFGTKLQEDRWCALIRLYEAEWEQRGFDGAP